MLMVSRDKLIQLLASFSTQDLIDVRKRIKRVTQDKFSSTVQHRIELIGRLKYIETLLRWS